MSLSDHSRTSAEIRFVTNLRGRTKLTRTRARSRSVGASRSITGMRVVTSGYCPATSLNIPAPCRRRSRQLGVGANELPGRKGTHRRNQNPVTACTDVGQKSLSCCVDGVGEHTACDARLRHDVVFLGNAERCLTEQVLSTPDVIGSRIDHKLAAACRKRCRFTPNPRALLVRLRTAPYIAMAAMGRRLLDAQRAVCVSAPGIRRRKRSRYKSMRLHNSFDSG